MEDSLYELANWLRYRLLNTQVLNMQTIGGSAVRHSLQIEIAKHLANEAIALHGHNMRALIEEMILEKGFVPVISMSDDELVRILRDMSDRECIFMITSAMAGQS